MIGVSRSGGEKEVLRLREMRLERNWSQMDLAVRLRPPRHPRIISGWENGYCMPKPEALRELARVFEVNIGQLFKQEPVREVTEK